MPTTSEKALSSPQDVTVGYPSAPSTATDLTSPALNLIRESIERPWAPGEKVHGRWVHVGLPCLPIRDDIGSLLFQITQAGWAIETVTSLDGCYVRFYEATPPTLWDRVCAACRSLYRSL